MRRLRFDGGLGKPLTAHVVKARNGNWLRIARAHKARNPQCVICGSIVGIEVDHIVPRHMGGSDISTNLQSLCKKHHAEKTAQENRSIRGGG